uniref:Uncharacterized protein n=1 Tax=Candidatus Kentrum sp. FM TaxID=2126340 RepID=A0A450S7M8_9GAMM|nr:MAG: hypothetical protein BECKFM1743A_GA0114220_100475 [Candidatus Kentron sp. FM]VFJ47877.1 MAG: hypothetical protein BECKFM1743C_GA0114222_1005116 [Candidatus Kentron sp. FM]VFK07836.1 MAG: hypothetical protein BECKFM1743B_GA0114221_100525 [Candidatus Kentron sp. FM]
MTGLNAFNGFTFPACDIISQPVILLFDVVRELNRENVPILAVAITLSNRGEITPTIQLSSRPILPESVEVHDDPSSYRPDEPAINFYLRNGCRVWWFEIDDSASRQEVPNG